MRTLKLHLKKSKFFWCSLFFHLLILLSYTFILVMPFQVKEKSPALFIPASMPAFVYHAQATSSHHQNFAAAKKIDVSDNGIEKPVANAKQTSLTSDAMEPISADSLIASHFNHKNAKKMDPVHLIGEKLLDDPLYKIIGIALTKHLIYPRMAQELNLKGVVSIQLMLYPDGQVTNVKLIKSSREKMLDAAALTAVNEMAPINNLDIYLKKPKQMVINVLFR